MAMMETMTSIPQRIEKHPGSIEVIRYFRSVPFKKSQLPFSYLTQDNIIYMVPPLDYHMSKLCYIPTI